ncbi:MAG: NUDIX domain-containing protein, partial [Candidatus Omnitrophica bacterium]|nr:NUDIX domain-containing protein [Candidatus Omnitrophota bacterium]
MRQRGNWFGNTAEALYQPEVLAGSNVRLGEHDLERPGAVAAPPAASANFRAPGKWSPRALAAAALKMIPAVVNVVRLNVFFVFLFGLPIILYSAVLFVGASAIPWILGVGAAVTAVCAVYAVARWFGLGGDSAYIRGLDWIMILIGVPAVLVGPFASVLFLGYAVFGLPFAWNSFIAAAAVIMTPGIFASVLHRVVDAIGLITGQRNLWGKRFEDPLINAKKSLIAKPLSKLVEIWFAKGFNPVRMVEDSAPLARTVVTEIGLWARYELRGRKRPEASRLSRAEVLSILDNEGVVEMGLHTAGGNRRLAELDADEVGRQAGLLLLNRVAPGIDSLDVLASALEATSNTFGLTVFVAGNDAHLAYEAARRGAGIVLVGPGVRPEPILDAVPESVIFREVDLSRPDWRQAVKTAVDDKATGVLLKRFADGDETHIDSEIIRSIRAEYPNLRLGVAGGISPSKFGDAAALGEGLLIAVSNPAADIEGLKSALSDLAAVAPADRPADNTQERIAIMDEDGFPTGEVKLRGEITPADWTRTLNGALLRKNPVTGRGEVLLQARSKKKKLFAGRMDISVAGMVTAGVSFLEAVREEYAEEVGIDVYPAEILRIGPPEGYAVKEYSEGLRRIEGTGNYEPRGRHLTSQRRPFFVTLMPNDQTITVQREELGHVEWSRAEDLVAQMESDPESLSGIQFMLAYPEVREALLGCERYLDAAPSNLSREEMLQGLSRVMSEAAGPERVDVLDAEGRRTGERKARSQVTP